jgi:hypothetical protein
MADINWLAVAAAVVAAFVISTVWYSIFGKMVEAPRRERRSGRRHRRAGTRQDRPRAVPQPGPRDRRRVARGPDGRHRLVRRAAARSRRLAGVRRRAADRVGALGDVAPRLAAIHAADWLLQLAMVGVLAGAWQ